MRAERPSLTPRQAEVAAGPIIGWGLWLDFATAVRALTETEAVEAMTDGQDRLALAAARHATVTMGADTRPEEAMLARLRQVSVSGGRFRLAGDDHSDPGVESFGWACRTGGKIVIAILPEVAGRALGCSGADVTEALRPVALLDREGRTTRPVSRLGRTIRAVCIPQATWLGEPVEPEEGD